MNTPRSLIAELTAFVEASADSPAKEILLDKVSRYRRERRTKPRPPPRTHPVDRTRGVMAAATYLLFNNKTVSLETLCNAVNKQNKNT